MLMNRLISRRPSNTPVKCIVHRHLDTDTIIYNRKGLPTLLLTPAWLPRPRSHQYWPFQCLNVSIASPKHARLTTPEILVLEIRIGDIRFQLFQISTVISSLLNMRSLVISLDFFIHQRRLSH